MCYFFSKEKLNPHTLTLCTDIALYGHLKQCIKLEENQNHNFFILYILESPT